MRSNSRKIKAAVIAGKAKIIRKDVTNVIQTNMGMRMSDIPGARRLMIVMMKLRAAATEATPSTSRPSPQKSMLRPGEYSLVVRFA